MKMRTFRIPYTSFQIVVWGWCKKDGRQKKPTAGFGIIVEQR